MDEKELHERGLKLRVDMFGREAVEKRMNAFGEFGKPLQLRIFDLVSGPPMPARATVSATADTSAMNNGRTAIFHVASVRPASFGTTWHFHSSSETVGIRCWRSWGSGGEHRSLREGGEWCGREDSNFQALSGTSTSS